MKSSFHAVKNNKIRPRRIYSSGNFPYRSIELEELDGKGEIIDCKYNSTAYVVNLDSRRIFAKTYSRAYVEREDILLNEVTALKKLRSHENIIQFYWMNSNANCIGFIFEYSEEGSLDKYIYTEKSKEVKKFQWLIQAATGLTYIHSCQIVHRDIGPHNFFLFGNTLKIGGFELAEDVSSGYLKINIVARSDYLAPELSLDFYSCDVYSFGISMLEIWDGKKYSISKEASDQRIQSIVRSLVNSDPTKRLTMEKVLKNLQTNFERKRKVEETIDAQLTPMVECLAGPSRAIKVEYSSPEDNSEEEYDESDSEQEEQLEVINVPERKALKKSDSVEENNEELNIIEQSTSKESIKREHAIKVEEEDSYDEMEIQHRLKRKADLSPTLIIDKGISPTPPLKDIWPKPVDDDEKLKTFFLLGEEFINEKMKGVRYFPQSSITYLENTPFIIGDFEKCFKVFNKKLGYVVCKISIIPSNATIKSDFNAWDNRHQNIISMYGFVFNETGHVGSLFEYMPGGNIHSYITSNRFTLNQIELNLQKSTWTRDIASGLHFLHENCIYHRNIDPSNILLSSNGQRAKIDGFSHSIKYPAPKITKLKTDSVAMVPDTSLEILYDKNQISYLSIDLYSYALTLHFIYYMQDPIRLNNNQYPIKGIALCLRDMHFLDGVEISQLRPPLGNLQIDELIRKCWKSNVKSIVITAEEIVDILFSPEWMAKLPFHTFL